MKLLFIANRFPYPPYRGDKLKIFNLAKQLAISNELHLITFAEYADDLEHLDKITPYFKKIEVVKLPKWKSYFNVLLGLFNSKPMQVSYFKSKSFKSRLALLLKENTYDGVHVQHLRMAQYAINLKNLYRILDLPDAFSLYWQRRKNTKRNFFQILFDRIESSRVARYEAHILREFDKCLVCSPEDKQYLEKTHQADNINLLPNGVDTAQFQFANHDYTHNNKLLFTGNMDYAPNIDAVVYFAHQILPQIQVVFPDIKFVIAGQRPVPKVMELGNLQNIEVTGFVPNLNDMYNSASVVVAPLRFGAGTQNKVLEAMSMGIPVVCTNIGFEGLLIKNGEGIFMETDSKLFAQRVIDLLHSETLRKTTGEKACTHIAEKFSWEIIASQLQNYFQNKNKTCKN